MLPESKLEKLESEELKSDLEDVSELELSEPPPKSQLIVIGCFGGK